MEATLQKLPTNSSLMSLVNTLFVPTIIASFSSWRLRRVFIVSDIFVELSIWKFIVFFFSFVCVCVYFGYLKMRFLFDYAVIQFNNGCNCN